MRSVIIYPEKDRYILKRIFKIFNSQNLKVDACTIDSSWTLPYLSALSEVLDGYSHLFIVLSSENLNDGWFLNLLGYIKGSKKESFFYFTEDNGNNDQFFAKFNVGHNYNDVLLYAEEESIRWENVQRKDIARNYLIDMGFALTEDAMGECVVAGQQDVVQNYIDAGYTSSCRNSKGVPMLCLAVRSNHIDIIKYLIDNGADINAISDDRHNTPIMDAASKGLLDAIQILVNEGADLECQSKNGQTALILAVGHGDVEVSNYLLSVGANYMNKDLLGMSAKSYATLFNKKEILRNMP
ncbi:MAG: hypothetical protein B6229_02025 [Spirochaetaceae bacterium 4572_7]|nr:MAG: hypothetical protein B6229_02025 [Spirochaetaceae bacterium 4572_7]